MSEPALKCENNATFKEIFTLKLFIAFKNPPKKFYNINCW